LWWRVATLAQGGLAKAGRKGPSVFSAKDVFSPKDVFSIKDVLGIYE
jgi:hypothetical protein